MALPRGRNAERERAEREAAQQRARLSLRLGVLGIVLLFGSGLGVWLAPDFVLAFLGGMVVAVLLLVAAFLLIHGSVLVFRDEEPGAKIL